MQKRMDYTDVIVRKYPEPVVVVLARDRQGVCNPISLGWSMPTSHDPPMWAVSLGVDRYSLEVIRGAGEFTIALPSDRMAGDVFFFGTNSGRAVGKLSERGVSTLPAVEIDCVLLADAVANFECILASEMVTGDHVILTGRVVAAHVNQNSEVRRLYTVAPGLVLGGVIPAEE